MKITKKENINIDSIVLKHKIALETVTILEERENLLYTDIMIYTMVSLLDNFIEESLIDLVNESEETDFATIIEDEIEPLYFSLIEENQQIKNLYEEIVSYVEEYFYNMEYKRNTMVGLFNTIIDSLGDFNWEDLKFFFQKLAHDTLNKNEAEEEEVKKEPRKATREEFEGATQQIKELIQKYQAEGQRIIEQRRNDTE